jgi:Ca2+-binding EF-hand superfamily protein
MRDIERVAMAHDFVWTEKELADMIRCFDSDGDGKVSSFYFWDFFLQFIF